MTSNPRPQPGGKREPLHDGLEHNLDLVKSAMGDSPDLIVKETICVAGWRTALLYIEGMVDLNIVHKAILESMMLHKAENDKAVRLAGCDRLRYLIDHVLVAGDSSFFDDTGALFSHLLSGDVLVLADGCPAGIRIGAAGWEDRNIGEPTSQAVVRGPMEAFTENIRTNTSLIRRKIKDPLLWMENRQIGRVTQTNVSMMYLKGVADESIVEEVSRRLDGIDIDGILEGGYIEELIQDKTLTPFPTVYNSERPDTIAAGLLEGRVAILVDGSPFVLLVPALFIHFFQSAEDYYQRADISTLLRIIRFVAFFIAMLAPSLYIAVTTYHQEMLPTNLLISLAAQREGVPFPAFIEALMMEVTYEILREAGVRMPRTVGQAVSIVGTLVIGQAAVEAGIVSAVMVIIVSITAISSFVIPAPGMSISVRMLRFVLMGLAASFGLFGILAGIIPLVLHLTGLRSFGVPYMSPFGPFHLRDHKDTLFRIPWPFMRLRPVSGRSPNAVRQRRKPIKR